MCDRRGLDGCRAIGRAALELVPQEARILTHCNAGALATAGYGTALGVVGGIALAQNIGTVVPFLEKLFGFALFPGDIYYLTELPSDLRSSDVIKFGGMSLAMGLLSTLYPSWRASRTQPAEALRYE